MIERPILFRGRLVRAILAGKKNQTRRLVKWKRGEPGDADQIATAGCPYGEPGDRLWVREAHAIRTLGPPTTWIAPGEVSKYGGGAPAPGDQLRHNGDDVMVSYREHPESPEELAAAPFFRTWRSADPPRWRPGIHMPRWASRLNLDVTGVRIERLHDISEADAWAEGIEMVDGELDDALICRCAKAAGRSHEDAAATFGALWSMVNGEDSWKANPHVWVVAFAAAPDRRRMP